MSNDCGDWGKVVLCPWCRGSGYVDEERGATRTDSASYVAPGGEGEGVGAERAMHSQYPPSEKCAQQKTVSDSDTLLKFLEACELHSFTPLDTAELRNLREDNVEIRCLLAKLNMEHERQAAMLAKTMLAQGAILDRLDDIEEDLNGTPDVEYLESLIHNLELRVKLLENPGPTPKKHECHYFEYCEDGRYRCPTCGALYRESWGGV